MYKNTAQAKRAENNVLKALLVVATHEPFHYGAAIKNITPATYQLQDSTGVTFEHSYTQSFGLVLRGTNNATGAKISHLAALDEASIYILQRDAIAPNIPFYPETTQLFAYPQEKLSAIKDFFTRLGYDDLTKITDLREADGPSLQLIQDIADKKQISSSEAYEYLIYLNYYLGTSTVSAQELIKYINTLEDPGKVEQLSGMLEAAFQSPPFEAFSDIITSGVI